MKTIEFFVILIQLFVPGALGVGDALLACVQLTICIRENPYARIIEAFNNARCAEVKNVTLNQPKGDTLIVDAFKPFYSPQIQYPYSLLHRIEGKDSIVLQEQGFTNGQRLRIVVPDHGKYYLVISDVNWAMLEFEVLGRDSLIGELRVGCVLE